MLGDVSLESNGLLRPVAEPGGLSLYFISRYSLSTSSLQSMVAFSEETFEFPLGISIAGCAQDVDDAQRKMPLSFSGIAMLIVDSMSVTTLASVTELLVDRPGLRLVILTDNPNGHYSKQCLELGVLGLLSRESPLAEVLKALREVSLGRKYVSRSISVAQQVGKSAGNTLAQYGELSDREKEILMAVSAGECIQSIATDLQLSPKTISTYRYRIFDKLMVENDVQLTRLAVKAGLVAL